MGVVAGAGVTLVVVLTRRRGDRPPGPQGALVPGSPTTPTDAPGPPAQPPRELLAAWVELLKDDLARAVNALNNRLNAVASLVTGISADNLTAEQQGAVEQVRKEVRRAAKITRGLLRRVSLLAPDATPPAHGRLESLPVSRPARILVVEDDSSNRTVITKLFVRLGHRVTAVSNGFEAYAVLERDQVDCVICDLRMPTVSGRTLFEQVEERLPHLTRRFVFVTGDYTRPSSREFLEQSGCPIVAKPYAVEELLGAVGEVLSGPGSLAQGG